MPSIYTVRKRTSSQVSLVRDLRQSIDVADNKAAMAAVAPSIVRFNQFWDLMETVNRHGYLRAAMSTIGRSAVGAWWSLRRHKDYPEAPELHRKKLVNFYLMKNRRWDNIKDFYSFAYKIMIGVMYLRYFGRAAYVIIRDEDGRAVGMDFLYGLVIPNVTSTGAFKEDQPAFVQYLSRSYTDRVAFNNPKDIIYLTNPDWEGSPMGGSDIEALTQLNLPIDLYLQSAAREYLKNRDKPEVIYEVSPDLSDDAFDAFVREMESRRGTSQMGRNPIAVQGEFKVHELKPYPNQLPYQESRTGTRDEALAVSGVSGAKLGLSDQITAGNLRELRREFHEATMVPLFRFIELAFYEQIHIREFGIGGWEFRFDRPDFLNEVEQATVDMRYIQMGVLSPNEIRYQLGLLPRSDEGGNEYTGQDKENDEIDQPQGSPPEGREPEPDDPSQIGEPTLDDQDPPRGDGHDDEPKMDWLKELRQWRRYTLKRATSGKALRTFNYEHIPDWLYELVSGYLREAQTPDAVAKVFDDTIFTITEALYG